MKKGLKSGTLLVLAALIGTAGIAYAEGKKETKPTAPAAKQELVISCWGGSSEKNLRAVSKAFEEKNNVTIVYDVGNNSDRLNKIRAQKASPVTDVALLSSGFAVMGNEEGLFEKVSAKDVPNLDKIYDFAKNKDGFGPIYSVTSYGIFYDTTKVKTPPTSWGDLWDPQYKGKIAVADIAGTSAPLLLIMAAQMYGKDKYDIDAGFKKMAELKDSIFNFYMSGSDVTAMFERGEIVMVPFLDMFLKSMQNSKLNVAMAVPKEGAFATPTTVNIVKGSPKAAIAQKYVDFLLSADVQAQIAKVMSESPVNKDTKLDPETAKYLVYGEEAAKKLVTFDDSFINKNKGAWIERWNKEISIKK
ncbi:MAG: ABC transporter substrate-binding protein [Treponemataceae bacterium]